MEESGNMKQNLLGLVMLLEQLNPMQLKAVSSFVNHHNSEEEWLDQVEPVLRGSDAEEVETLVALVTQDDIEISEGGEDQETQLQNLSQKLQIPDLEAFRRALLLLMSLYQLQLLVQSLSILQLMKLFEIMPPGHHVQQLQLLQQIQQLFGQLQPKVLANLHKQLEETHPGTEQQTLIRLLNLPAEYFQLYQPLRLLLQLSVDELSRLQESLPKLQPTQMLQLLQLLQLQPFDVLELRNLLNPSEPGQEVSAETAARPSISQSLLEVPVEAPPTEVLHVQIVEQPPEKSVYKRNLKPNPMVMLVGDQKANDGNLYVVPTLIRCDTFMEEPKFLTGNRPVRVTSGRVITFRKLKIITTSHQQQETLFCVKFELRRYADDEEYEVLESALSNPISVLSHSTQMKPVIPSSAPTISEVIPAFGPPSGGTRVAVLGTNFVDSPAARVRFDTTDVMPIFHGAGTLICETPQHPCGVVAVKVCNSTKKWSETTGSFTYDDHYEAYAEQVPVADQSRQSASDDDDLPSASWSGDVDRVHELVNSGTDVNSADSRSFSPLQYSCANGNVGLCDFLLERGAAVNYQDKYGNTALHWAILAGYDEVAQSLVDHGANINIPSFSGATPIFSSILEGNETVLKYLILSNARINTPMQSGISPLHAACALGQVGMAVALIQNGAFLHATDFRGETALFYAIREGKFDVVQFLLNQGSLVDAANDDKETPLHLASEIGDEAMSLLLLNRGARVNEKDATGSTPMHIATQLGHEALVKLFTDHGGDPNIRDKEGKSSLHYAAQFRENKIAEELVLAGTCLDIRDKEGHTVADSTNNTRNFLQGRSCSGYIASPQVCGINSARKRSPPPRVF